jgi:predicted nucleic acid-binding protein
VTLLVDTSVWSLAFRRDAPRDTPEVAALRRGLELGHPLATTGLVLQELLQGFTGPRAREQIIESFSALPFLVPERNDHIGAAGLRNRCRRAGVQVGTIDALLAQLCLRYDLALLTTDKDSSGLRPTPPSGFGGLSRRVAVTAERSFRRAREGTSVHQVIPPSIGTTCPVM